MYISLQELETKTVRFEVDVPPGRINYDSKIKQTTGLEAKGSARLLNSTLGEIRVEGDLRVEVEGVCDRCLEGAKYAVANHFDLLYVPAGESEASGEDEVEEAGMDVGYYEGNGLELNDILREVVLLTLPMRLICNDECRGICPVCGQNRNQRDCGCAPESTDDRWSKLKSLRQELTPRG
jgi:uncharacterized protein